MKLKEKYNWGGWQNCLLLSNDAIDLVATTDIGPRIMRLGFLGERNIFLEIEDELGKTGGNDYRLYGGARLWHSPENNPRSYYPDNVPVDYRWDNKTLTLLQPVESTNGMQKEINITLGPSGNKVELIYRIYNRNLWPIKYAPWALTLMAQGGKGIIPQEPYQKWEENLLPVRPLVLWSYTKMDDPRWSWGSKYIQLKQDPSADNPQKVGLLNKQGWIAYCIEDYVFIKSYGYNDSTEYPDFQCNTEVYADPKLFELETLGALCETEPGKYLEHRENWYIFKARIDENEKSINKVLLPLIESTDIPAPAGKPV